MAARIMLLKRASISLFRNTATTTTFVTPSISNPRGIIHPFQAAACLREKHTKTGFGGAHEKNSLESEPFDNVTLSSSPEQQMQVGADSVEGNSNEDMKKHKAISSLKTSSRHDLAMIFTCKVCETRSVKTTCRESYEKGIVVVRCSGCDNLHLMADHLGWFGKPGTIEELLAARGEEVKKGSADTLSLTLEDLTGTQA